MIYFKRLFSQKIKTYTMEEPLSVSTWDEGELSISFVIYDTETKRKLLLLAIDVCLPS